MCRVAGTDWKVSYRGGNPSTGELQLWIAEDKELRKAAEGGQTRRRKSGARETGQSEPLCCKRESFPGVAEPAGQSARPICVEAVPRAGQE
jgi:hypothetical protein